MTTGQLLTIATLAVAALLALLGAFAGASYFFHPYAVSFAGNELLPPGAFSGQALFYGLCMAAAGMAAGWLLVQIQQAIVKVFFEIEMGRIRYCYRQIKPTFGSEAADRWIEEKVGEMGLDQVPTYGIFGR